MKLWIAGMIVLAGALLLLAGCAATKQNSGKESTASGVESAASSVPAGSGYRNISPQDAKKRLDSEKGIVLLDVRTPEEYAQKHIPGSLLIPVDEIETQAAAKLADKDAVIFVYCRSGRRSVTASEALVGMGYSQVYNLGGINDWPYETETGSN